MKSSQVSSGDIATPAQYNNLREDARASSWLLAHQKGTPDLQLYVEPSTIYAFGALLMFAGGNSPTFTAPAANPRIDLLSIDSTGTLIRTAGVEAASPVEPALPAGNAPICQVYNRVGQTTILDVDTTGQGYIYKDTRMFFAISKAPIVRKITAIGGTFTVTIASPAVFTCSAHGFAIDDPVMLTTTGALPTGLSANTTYWVISAGFTTSAFRLSLTKGGAAINTSGSQSGTHTVSPVYIPTAGAIGVTVEGVGGGGSTIMTASGLITAAGSAGYFKKTYDISQLTLTGEICKVGKRAISAQTSITTRSTATTFKACTANGGGCNDATDNSYGGTASGGDVNVNGENKYAAGSNSVIKYAGGSTPLGTGGGYTSSGTGYGSAPGGANTNNTTWHDGQDGVLLFTEVFA